MLNTLLVRGRHMQISTFMSVQKMRLAGSILRVNAQALCMYRLRNRLELDAIVEELSAVYDKTTLMDRYELATREPYSFWYIHLAAKRREDMFFLRFEKRMIPNSGKETKEMGALLQMLLKAMPLRPSPHESDTEVEVLAPILCCSTVTVEESDHTVQEEHEHRGGLDR